MPLRTTTFNTRRDLYRQNLLELHNRHVLSDLWMLETCEYCRFEYYLEVLPLGVPDSRPATE